VRDVPKSVSGRWCVRAISGIRTVVGLVASKMSVAVSAAAAAVADVALRKAIG